MFLHEEASWCCGELWPQLIRMPAAFLSISGMLLHERRGVWEATLYSRNNRGSEMGDFIVNSMTLRKSFNLAKFPHRSLYIQKQIPSFRVTLRIATNLYMKVLQSNFHYVLDMWLMSITFKSPLPSIIHFVTTMRYVMQSIRLSQPRFGENMFPIWISIETELCK